MRIYILIAAIFLVHSTSYALDMGKVAMIESGGHSYAYNARTRATGLYQVTPICLDHYNQYNIKKYTMLDMYDAQKNSLVAHWYFGWLDKYITKKGYKVTDELLLIGYHDGPRNLVKYIRGQRSLGPEMRAYLSKYNN